MDKDLKPENYMEWKHCETYGAKTLCNLKELLTQIQKGHKEDIYTYTSGHLNPDKLYKPPDIIVQHWYNANRPKEKPATFPPTLSGGKKVAKMKDALVYFSVNTALHPDDAYSSKLFKYLNPQMFQSYPSNDDDTSEELPQEEEEDQELKERHVFSRESHKKEELVFPEMKVLRYPEVTSSRQCARPASGGDVYRYITSYLSGVTKTDRYKKFLSFQREVLAKEDLLKNDFTGSKVAVIHENKLKEELQKVCTCNPHQFNRLQVFGEIFEEVCRSSLVFGDLLKEIKDEYELYMAALLDSQPTAQYERLLAEVKGLEKSPVHTADVDQAKEHLKKLEKATLEALQHNDRLRSELEAERQLLETAKEKSELREKNIQDEDQLTLIEKVEKRRCEILEKWDEIKALEKHVKKTSVHSRVMDITESAIKSIENEGIKLETTNRILRKKIKGLESQIKQLIRKSKIKNEDRKVLLDLVGEYADVEEVEDDSDIFGKYYLRTFLF
ncbi:uncharacterized protein C6orf118 homolog isoform X2 [Meriones unguiculatus]|uniref:uncharacterized protein C6orf118 homolog isoform X2 n=1 Tax=Meriones unguiculatus TaxID=10047 RepID=UPI00293F4912|nr:uncharacterized protein C6orf118 homolog isoform X2 [Meriones unguiculatus]